MSVTSLETWVRYDTLYLCKSADPCCHVLWKEGRRWHDIFVTAS